MGLRRLATGLLACLTTMLLVFDSAGYAQLNNTRIAYGDIIQATITDETFAHRYSFIGAAGDILVAEMRSVDRSFENPLDAPNLILEGPDGVQIASTESLYPVDDTTLAAELPADGAYVITATREGGILGTSYGDFTLRLLLPDAIPDENPLEQPITSDEPAAYLTISGPQPFSLLYTRTGDFAPEIRVGHIETGTGRIAPDVMLSGALTTRAEVGIFTAGTAYVIVITPNPWGFDFETATAIISFRRVTTETV